MKEQRLNLDDPNVFDKWRALYEELSDEEQHKFADECAVRFPSQEHHDLSCHEELFSKFTNPENARVLEIGGWKGELAQKCLKRWPIEHWLNIEFCRTAFSQQVFSEVPRYRVANPLSFRWFKYSSSEGEAWHPETERSGVLLASHVIEHFSATDLLFVIDFFKTIPVLMFEAPLEEGPSNWKGYLGTHKLEWGWRELDLELFQIFGYKAHRIRPYCTVYKRENPFLVHGAR